MTRKQRKRHKLSANFGERYRANVTLHAMRALNRSFRSIHRSFEKMKRALRQMTVAVRALRLRA